MTELQPLSEKPFTEKAESNFNAKGISNAEELEFIKGLNKLVTQSHEVLPSLSLVPVHPSDVYKSGESEGNRRSGSAAEKPIDPAALSKHPSHGGDAASKTYPF